MSDLHGNLLSLAEQLLAMRGLGSATRRRAVSTAYYAVFHRLADLCARRISGSAPSEPEFQAAYRILDHGSAAQALVSNAEFRPLGATFKRLLDARAKADYVVISRKTESGVRGGPGFSKVEAADWVEQARSLVSAIDALDLGAKRRLAILLILDGRSGRRRPSPSHVVTEA